jgi:hypothetical protein
MALSLWVNTHDGMAGNVRAILVQESSPLPASMSVCQVYVSYLVGFYLIRYNFHIMERSVVLALYTFSQTLFGWMWSKVYISGRFFIYYKGLGIDYNGNPGFVKQKWQMARKRLQAPHLFRSRCLYPARVLICHRPGSLYPAREHTMSIATRPLCPATERWDDYQLTRRLIIDRHAHIRHLESPTG